MRITRWRFLAIYIPSAIACWGIGYLAGIQNGTGASMAAGYGGGLALTLAIIAVLRRRSYAAGIRVENWRDRAVALRLSDPETYNSIVAQAQGSEAEGAAQRDPDAYVALFLSYADEASVDRDHADDRVEELDGFRCPACGKQTVSVDGEIALWVCSECTANGPIVDGTQIDIGLRGNPRDGEYEQYRPRVPVATQLADEIPGLDELSSSDAARLDLAFYDWCFQLFGTEFDIPDDDARIAEAINARNVLGDPTARQDDIRFYTLTALSTAGWQWRRAEQMGREPSAPEIAHHWAEKYLTDGTVTGRSEAIGLTAAAIVDSVDLERHSPGGMEHGAVFFEAGWLLAMYVLDPTKFSEVHPPERHAAAFRFGVALRDAQVACDAVALASA